MGERVFSLLHLSLVGIREPKFETYRGDRESWLRLVFEKSFQFSGWGGKELVWVPRGGSEDIIFGLIQGKKPYNFHEPPSAGGMETAGDFWQGAYVFIDPTHHDDGQKIAIENDVLGKPRALAKALFDAVNEREDAAFRCFPELIFDENDFWKFAKDSNGKMRFIKFKFVVPNMWGPQNDLEKDLEETGRETGSEEVEVTFKAEQGVSTDNEKVKTAVSYTGRGAGEIEAKNLDGKRYSSKMRPTTEKVSESDLDQVDDYNLGRIARRVLGRG